MVYKSVLDLIGNTPLVEISKDIHNLKNGANTPQEKFRRYLKAAAGKS